ncbi:MAG: hypothetical protein KF841_14375 [Phycisphaerae bacterium]|nr:hypothetical protein [Phycisphaerae bacterium]
MKLTPTNKQRPGMRRLGRMLAIAGIGAVSTQAIVAAGQITSIGPRYTRDTLAVARQHPDAPAFIANRRAGLVSWAARYASNAATMEQAVQCAHWAATYQALTGDKTFERELLAACRRIAGQWPGAELSALSADKRDYQLFVTNPEPVIITLSRVAALHAEARDVLRPVLARELDRLRRGDVAWPYRYGKVSLCLVEIKRALGLPCDPMADDGAIRGLKFMLDHCDESGWPEQMVGSVWYINNNWHPVLVGMGRDIRDKMTDADRAKFDAAYSFPFRFSVAGAAGELITPNIGEDFAIQRRQSSAFYTGAVANWPGDDAISAYMRYRARREVDLPVQFNDLFMPPVPTKRPPVPPLKPREDFGVRATILRQLPDGGAIVIHWCNGRQLRAGEHAPELDWPIILKLDQQGHPTRLSWKTLNSR